MLRDYRFFRENGNERRNRRGYDSGTTSLVIPHCVEDAIADIATIFHWAPSVFDEMDLAELMLWREKARERSQSDD
ncbi:GpE family phage tail protein [Canicola haemoglobinophilus]|uniref:GpE family phage tail protein n=1 Tax=Canicola haemoglobinophilus TaxID=733 RepID=UPI0039A051EB